MHLVPSQIYYQAQMQIAINQNRGAHKNLRFTFKNRMTIYMADNHITFFLLTVNIKYICK